MLTLADQNTDKDTLTRVLVLSQDSKYISGYWDAQTRGCSVHALILVLSRDVYSIFKISIYVMVSLEIPPKMENTSKITLFYHFPRA